MLHKRDKEKLDNFLETLNNVKKKKIYISGPVSVYHNDDFATKEFIKIEEWLKTQTNNEYIIVNPVKFNSDFEGFNDMTWGDFMVCDLVILNVCDIIYMCDGWEISHGAIMEKNFAEKNGLKVINKYTFKAKEKNAV